ncbi:hypothetical protein PSTT_06872 [Puccinia striiformis]|uniref:No apical meristem-associated C-terminal domain-containing protein n=1 Tax=Puccinia striiformis TaxID=27350 RepID=A0A2S4VIG4_9BASI|nr:hypothetical protein PSTT_06872 [Puccinia striiformis]
MTEITSSLPTLPTGRGVVIPSKSISNGLAKPDSRPKFSESRGFLGSSGLATRLAKQIQGRPNPPHPSQFGESAPTRQTSLASPRRPSSRQFSPFLQQAKSPNNEIENKKEESDLLETKPKQTKGANWRIEEDEALCKSWLNTSKDAVTGTDQTKPKFWLRIHGMFVDLMDDVTDKKKNIKGFKPFPTRLQKALEDRWYHISHQALEAKALFRQDNGNKQFTLDHCWALLHCHHKWKQFLDEAALGGKSKGKENKLPPSSTPDPSVVDGLSSGQAQESEIEVSGRPEGSKAAKKRKHDEINIGELIKSQKEMLELSRKNNSPLNHLPTTW